MNGPKQSEDDFFAGRQAELATLRSLYDSGERLITISGPPGIGKSRFVAHWAARVDQQVVPVDLSSVADASELFDRVATALSVDRDPAEPWRSTMATALRRFGELILVADGFDRLVTSAESTVGAWLSDAPELTVVVTTRERLALPLERCVVLGALEEDDAVDLFCHRARQVMPQFSLTDGDDSVATLARELDGNPLALELAAARVRTFPPRELLTRLDRRFALLRSRDQSASLESAIALSWELLSDSERRLLHQCTLFRGGFTLDAAEAVLRCDNPSEWSLDVVDALVEKSLLQRVEAGSGVRFELSSSIHDFVSAQAGQVNGEAMMRHARHHVDRQTGTEETENLRAVVERFSTDDDSADLAAHAALRLDSLFRRSGTTPMHLAALNDGVESARHADEPELLSDLLFARGELFSLIGRLEEAERDLSTASEVVEGDRSVRAAIRRAEVERRTGRAGGALSRLEAQSDSLDTRGTGRRRHLLAHLAACQCDVGALGEARQTLLDVPPPSDLDPLDEYAALKRLAYVHYYLGNWEHQQTLNQRALELAESEQDRRRVAQALQGLGDAAFARGDYREACARYDDALSAHRALGNLHLEGVLLGNQGTAYHRLGELPEAARCYEASVAIHRQTGAHPYEAVVTYARGVLEHELGHLEDASFLYSQALALFEELEQSEDVAATHLCRFLLQLRRQDLEQAELELTALKTAASDQEWLHEVPLLCEALLAGRSGRDADARELLDRSLELPNDTAVLLAATLVEWGTKVEEERVRQAREGAPRSLHGRLVTALSAQPTNREPSGQQGREVAVPERRALIVGEGGSWFQIGQEEPVNLRRRRAHRLILDQLVELHETGGGLDVYDAFDIGWPGETADAESAAERVYWVIGSLRKLGLEPILLTSDAGYYLDSAVAITRRTEPAQSS